MEDDLPLAHYEPPLQKNNLTFGVEIEFALATAAASGIGPEPHLGGQIFGMPDWQIGCELTRNTLNGVGVPAEIEVRSSFYWKPFSDRS
jgi:hypothetical protein